MEFEISAIVFEMLDGQFEIVLRVFEMLRRGLRCVSRNVAWRYG
jgi:hypothetical protein